MWYSTNYHVRTKRLPLLHNQKVEDLCIFYFYLNVGCSQELANKVSSSRSSLKANPCTCNLQIEFKARWKTMPNRATLPESASTWTHLHFPLFSVRQRGSNVIRSIRSCFKTFLTEEIENDEIQIHLYHGNSLESVGKTVETRKGIRWMALFCILGFFSEIWEHNREKNITSRTISNTRSIRQFSC